MAPVLDYTAIPAWVLAASLLVWAFAFLGLAVVIRAAIAFVRGK